MLKFRHIALSFLGIILVAAATAAVRILVERAADGIPITFGDGTNRKTACARANRNPAAAVEACTAYIDNPASTPGERAAAFRIRAYHHANARQYALAIAGYTETLRISPRDVSALVGRARAYTDVGEYGKAMADYDSALAAEPDNAFAVNDRGHLLMSLGDHTRAIADFDRALALNPTDAYAYANRSNANRLLRYIDRALADADKAIALTPRYAFAHRMRGLANLERGQFVEAEADFSRAIDIEPRTDVHYYHRALAFEMLDQRELALRDLDRAVALDPRDAKFLRKRAMLYIHFGRWREAILDLTGVLALKTGDTQALMLRAQAYENIGERENAIADHRAILRFNPMNPDSQSALKRLGAPTGTVSGEGCRDPRLPAPDRLADCAKAIAAPGSTPDVRVASHLARGQIYLLMNDIDKALADFEHAIKLKPGLAEAHAQRGLALMRRGNHAAALKDFDRAVAIDAATRPQILLYRANALIQLARFEPALADLDKAVALMPNNPAVFQLRGLAHERLGKREQAISDYREALKRFPQFGDAQDGLRRLGVNR